MADPETQPAPEPCIPIKPVRLHSPTMITVATVLGAPIAGCILLAHNLRALGKRSVAREWLLGGLVATALIMVVAYFLPDRFPRMALPIGYILGMQQAVKHAHGAEYEAYIAAGGAKAPAWIAVVVGLVCMLAILVAVLLVILALPE